MSTLTVFCCSAEMIANFSIDVAEVVADSSVSHGLGVNGFTPNRFFDVLLVNHVVLFSFFHVTFLRANSLVIASVKRITFFESSKQGIFNELFRLLRECFISSECPALVIEGSSLLNMRSER